MRTLSRLECPERGLLPNPYNSDEDQRRFRHQDLSHLTPAQLWAEERLLESALALRIFVGGRPRPMSGGELIGAASLSEQEWLAARLRRIAETRRTRRRSA